MTGHPVRRFVRSRGFQRLLRWGLGGAFVYAGALKLANREAFAIQLERYGLLPAHWLDPVALVLPLLEVVAGFAVILGLTGGAEVVAALLLVFLAALGHAWWASLDIPCGCFSLEDEQRRFGIQMAIVRDLALLAAAVALTLRRRTPPN